MAKNQIERIRALIRQLRYDMTAHAMEEMAEGFLDINDIEHAILTGQVARIERDDLRGSKYVIEGVALGNKIPVGVVGRFATENHFLIITVYEITP